MKKLLVVLSAVVMFFALSGGMAGAALLDFDDLSGTLTSIPDGYGDYHWSNFSYLDATNHKYKKSGYSAGLVSSQNVVYNSLAYDASVSADQPFTFDGAYLTGAWRNGLHVVVTGYRSGTLIGSDDFITSAYKPTWYAPTWTGAVDQLTFHSYGGEIVKQYPGSMAQFAMDNFKATPVPLPPSLLLLAPGVIGIAVIRRRRAGK